MVLGIIRPGYIHTHLRRPPRSQVTRPYLMACVAPLARPRPRLRSLTANTMKSSRSPLSTKTGPKSSHGTSSPSILHPSSQHTHRIPPHPGPTSPFPPTSPPMMHSNCKNCRPLPDPPTRNQRAAPKPSKGSPPSRPSQRSTSRSSSRLGATLCAARFPAAAPS